jgi:hypothetical protein
MHLILSSPFHQFKNKQKIQVAKKTSRRKKVPDLTQKERERERDGDERGDGAEGRGSHGN